MTKSELAQEIISKLESYQASGISGFLQQALDRLQQLDDQEFAFIPLFRPTNNDITRLITGLKDKYAR